MCDSCWVVLTQYKVRGVAVLPWSHVPVTQDKYHHPSSVSCHQLHVWGHQGTGHGTLVLATLDSQGSCGEVRGRIATCGRDIVKLSPYPQHSLVMVMARPQSINRSKEGE